MTKLLYEHIINKTFNYVIQGENMDIIAKIFGNIFTGNLAVIEYIIRLILAMALGFSIGLERKMRLKEAGPRTHTIMCLGATLFTIL